MNKVRWYSNLFLLLAALIWGMNFVAQSVGMAYIGSFTFVCVRCVIGGIILIPCVFIIKKLERKSKKSVTDSQKNKKSVLIIGGCCCGTALAIASILQQFGIMYTTVGKAGFITTMYIVIIPLVSMFFGKKSSKYIWVSVVIAVIGMYLLCINDRIVMNKGDFLILLCAFCFSGHILIINYFSPKADCLQMSCIQLFFCAFISFWPMIIFEKPEFSSIINALLPLLYAGVLSSAIAYTLQIVGQKNTDPAVASLLMSLESVFAALAGWILLKESLSYKEILGCCLMFVAIIIAQIPDLLYKNPVAQTAVQSHKNA